MTREEGRAMLMLLISGNPDVRRVQMGAEGIHVLFADGSNVTLPVTIDPLLHARPRA